MSDIAEIFSAYPVAFAAFVAVLGLIIGSFLNVVIARLPIMLEREWRMQCAEGLGMSDTQAAEEPFNLARPGSTCPNCGHRIRAWENIPLLSYVMLRGRCSQCGARIALRYPLVELLTAVTSVVVVLHFGFGWQAAAGLLLTWVLIALAFIDIDHQQLPDIITIPVLWIGLLLGLFGIFAALPAAVIGAMAGYLLLWVVYHVFRWVTGREGMGYGDFKMLALLGAWLGWQQLPLIVLVASLAGAVFGSALIALRGRDKNTPIPFGPYLATAGWIAMLWGEAIVGAYLENMGRM